MGFCVSGGFGRALKRVKGKAVSQLLRGIASYMTGSPLPPALHHPRSRLLAPDCPPGLACRIQRVAVLVHK